jgi:uncharacterized CHY-type Zn-finger protein
VEQHVARKCHETNESGKSAIYRKRLSADSCSSGNKSSYKTSFIILRDEKGKACYFFHNEHTDIYGLDCKSCHQQESCAKCHSTEPEKKLKRFRLEENTKIVCCHDTKLKQVVRSCHSSKEMAPFNHLARTGFTLKVITRN